MKNREDPIVPGRMQIVILEDNLDRRRLMKEMLDDRFRQYDVRFFLTAGEAIAHLRENYDRLLAIVLDHDLDLIPVDGHRLIDSGSGRDVADFLATQPAVCPVVVHSTNSPAAIGMLAVMDESGWTTHRVIPMSELEWIPTVWFPTVRNAIVAFVGTEKAVATAR